MSLLDFLTPDTRPTTRVDYAHRSAVWGVGGALADGTMQLCSSDSSGSSDGSDSSHGDKLAVEDLVGR